MIDKNILLKYESKGKNILTRDGFYLKSFSKEIGGFSVTLLQQNTRTGSKWAKLALDGNTVVQVFVDGGFYGVFVNGKLINY
jgi:hypothetical protein